MLSFSRRLCKKEVWIFFSRNEKPLFILMCPINREYFNQYFFFFKLKNLFAHFNHNKCVQVKYIRHLNY